jgi:predicted TIM-barrel fold metal-dependent hydrolase
MNAQPASTCSRRQFLAAGSLILASSAMPGADVEPKVRSEPIIDIHQHTGYSGRTDAQLISHQRAMGVTTTFLLPAGRPVNRPSTHDGKSNGLAAQCRGNESVAALVRRLPGEFQFFANEVTDLPEARAEIESFLKRGALGIGEQKFAVDCNAAFIHDLAELAGEYQVPILMHFQHGAYNLGIERFHEVLDRHPRVNFIGHAQTWWGNIDKSHDQTKMYPTGPVTPGGITDRLLSDYPNLFGDLSAGSGLNALLRDEEHTASFLKRHQDKLLYGSDCNDNFGRGPGCQGAQTLAAIRRMAPDKLIERKLLFANAAKLFKLGPP